MLNLANIKIYETEYNSNHILTYVAGNPVIDSFLVLDSQMDLKNVFEELFESIKYEYCDYPRTFKMCVKLVAVKEENLPWNAITRYYSEYQVNDYDDIEELHEFNQYRGRN